MISGWLLGVPPASLLLAVSGYRLARRNAKIERRADARTEAIDLAEVRGQVIADREKRILDLEKRITEVETNSRHAIDKSNEKVELLEKVMEHQRQDAMETQRLLVINFRGALLKLLAHLEGDPPQMDEAIDYLREALNGDAPPPPRRRRRAA